MPKKKERERFHFDQLRKALPNIPAIDATETEAPDFLLIAPGIRLGIEVTAFDLPPASGERPGKEIRSLRERVVSMAEGIYRQAGGPALYVSVIFSSTLQLSKEQVRPMAAALADVILSRRVPLSVHEPTLRLDFGEVPPGILHIRVHGSVDGADKLWSVSSGGWVAPILPDHIKVNIARKSKMAGRARKRCDELWLVIVHDYFSELSEEARAFSYLAPFDKIWLLDPSIPSAIELKRGEPSPP